MKFTLPSYLSVGGSAVTCVFCRGGLIGRYFPVPGSGLAGTSLIEGSGHFHLPPPRDDLPAALPFAEGVSTLFFRPEELPFAGGRYE